MNEEKFHRAGWVAIIAGLLFPFTLLIDAITEAAETEYFETIFTGIGIADFFYLAFALFSIYVYKMLKQFMFECYSFKKLNMLINIIIGFFIVYYFGLFLVELIFTLLFSSNDVGPPLFLITFDSIGVFIFGLLDIMFGGMILLKGKEFSIELKALAVIAIILGLCEATVILSFFAIGLVPLFFFTMAFIFFRKRQQEVEFV